MYIRPIQRTSVKADWPLKNKVAPTQTFAHFQIIFHSGVLLAYYEFPGTFLHLLSEMVP